MDKLKEKIGFIGAGNMAEAMISALIATGASSPDAIFISDVDSKRLDHLRSVYGIQPLADNAKVVDESTLVIFAIKPQQMVTVLDDLSRREAFAAREDRKLFVSIAAGIRIKTLEDIIYAGKSMTERVRMPILRVMPNTPALVQAGMCALCGNSQASPDDMERTMRILSAMGKAMVFDEEQMDTITAISGSGPAYCFYLIEALIAAGEQLGLAADDAAALTIATFSGSLRLLEQMNESPGSLRRKVTSPGGTTEAAIRILDGRDFKTVVLDAVSAAAERSRQLSGGK